MDFAQNAPLRKTTPTNAPATIHSDVSRAGRVSLIFEQKYEHFCFLAFKYVRSMDDAKDIVATVFEGALKNWSIERYEAILNLEAYMYRSVRNAAINVAKRNKYLLSIHDFPIDTFIISNPMEKFDLNLDAFVQLLPNKQREAFVLFSQGYSHKEIAKLLELDTEGASNNLIYYAKKNLKKLISDMPEFDPDDRGPFNSGRGQAKKQTDPNRRALNINPGSTPKVKDLLSFISGGALKESNKRTILQWLINENFAFEIISGIQIALKNNRANSIEARLRNDKSNLRAQLFGSSIQPEVQNKPKHLLSLRPDLKNISLIEFEVPGAHRNDFKTRAYMTCLLFNQRSINPIRYEYITAISSKKMNCEKPLSAYKEFKHDSCLEHVLAKNAMSYKIYLTDLNLITHTPSNINNIVTGMEIICIHDTTQKPDNTYELTKKNLLEFANDIE